MADTLIDRGMRVLKEDGLLTFSKRSARFCIEYVQERYLESKFRELLPKHDVQKFNGVVVGKKRMFDDIFSVLADKPEYEGQYVEYLREYVERGDTVVVIGGLYGVSTVAAASQVGSDGDVITFEATSAGADRVRKTARLNDVNHIVTVEAATIGSVYSLKGRSREENEIPPE